MPTNTNIHQMWINRMKRISLWGLCVNRHQPLSRYRANNNDNRERKNRWKNNNERTHIWMLQFGAAFFIELIGRLASMLHTNSQSTQYFIRMHIQKPKRIQCFALLCFCIYFDSCISYFNSWLHFHCIVFVHRIVVVVVVVWRSVVSRSVHPCPVQTIFKFITQYLAI